jgi:hypothetical protein
MNLELHGGDIVAVTLDQAEPVGQMDGYSRVQT